MSETLIFRIKENKDWMLVFFMICKIDEIWCIVNIKDLNYFEELQGHKEPKTGPISQVLQIRRLNELFNIVLFFSKNSKVLFLFGMVFIGFFISSPLPTFFFLFFSPQYSIFVMHIHSHIQYLCHSGPFILGKVSMWTRYFMDMSVEYSSFKNCWKFKKIRKLIVIYVF